VFGGTDKAVEDAEGVGGPIIAGTELVDIASSNNRKIRLITCERACTEPGLPGSDP